MGVALILKVIISFNIIGRIVAIQPGNYKWVIVIKKINITR